jgi:hypothetical protein
MVWDETVRIVNGFFDTAWGDREVVVVDDCLSDITLPVRSPMKTPHKQANAYRALLPYYSRKDLPLHHQCCG